MPLDEYKQVLLEVAPYFKVDILENLSDYLIKHYEQLKDMIRKNIQADVAFIHPMENANMTIEDSYVWPYENLEIDIGIEEMEEIYIPHLAMTNGNTIPPVLLGMFGVPNPYYEQRKGIFDMIAC